MQDIKIGRYDPESTYGIGADGEHLPIGFSGWVEDHDETWIIFLGEDGKPALYWSERDEKGGVIGSPMKLAA